MIDARDRILFANRLLADSIGLDPHKVAGTNASSIAWIHDEEAELPWKESLRTREMVNGRILQFDIEGRRLTFNVNCTPILDQGLMVTFEDITQLEENKAKLAMAVDAAERANQSKSAVSWPI